MLPSLKDRSDLPELIASIVRDEMGSDAGSVSFSTAVMDLFCRYPWPGNIRELRNVLRFVTSLHAGKKIEVEDLPDQILDFSRNSQPGCTIDPLRTGYQSIQVQVEERREPALPAPAPTPLGATLHESNEAAERRRIVEVLRANRWNVTEAANQLGISRATLHRKIRRYAITSPNNQD